MVIQTWWNERGVVIFLGACCGSFFCAYKKEALKGFFSFGHNPALFSQ